MTEDEARIEIKVAIARSGKRQAEWAKDLGVSAPYLSACLKPGGKPIGPKLCKAVGLKRRVRRTVEVTYSKN